MAVNQKKLSMYSLLFVFVGSPIIFVVFIMDIFGLYSRNHYDVTNQPNLKMITIVNKQIDSLALTYESKKETYIPEAGNNFRNYMKSLKSIQTYSRHGSNSLLGYNGIDADFTHIDGTVEKGEYITSGAKFKQTKPKLQMYIEIKNGKAIKVLTNGLEKNNTPLHASKAVDDILKSITRKNFTDRRELYYYPVPAPPDPKTEWEKIK